MAPLKFAVLGTGFWSHFQISGWREVGGVELAAVYNRTVSKAERVAAKFNVPRVYGDLDELFQKEKLDFVDIVTEIDAHAPFVKKAAQYGLPVICQKPMAPDLATAEDMVETCRKARVPLFIHENWRWQTPIRAIQQLLREDRIGRPFRARIDMISGFPVFDNQPFLKTLKHFILTDLGSHILDVARFLFGEATSLYCQTRQIHKDIQGEDVATVVMRMGNGTTAVCNMAYAGNFLEHDHFPQTYMFIEGESGSLELGPDYWIRLTTKDGTLSKRVPPPRYSWADPAYDVVHASIVPCNKNLLAALKGEGQGETTGEDNLKTVRLVFGAYDSAERDEVRRF
ncbi:MAG: gfo/Idh/MocA family oxidoreductase [Acidobacteria bacterium]|nr:MAG: gfo/Idh/MocA family oxidoreductase [Acidobacteriota bacterium]